MLKKKQKRDALLVCGAHRWSMMTKSIFSEEQEKLAEAFALGMSLTSVAKNETYTRLQYLLFDTTVPGAKSTNQVYFPLFCRRPTSKRNFYKDMGALYERAVVVADMALEKILNAKQPSHENRYATFVEMYDATYRDAQRLRRLCAAIVAYKKANP